MIPIYNLAALGAACAFTGGSVAMLYPLATMWRLERRRQSSREPFSGVNIEAFSEPARQLALDALAHRARKPTPLWPSLACAVLSGALACRLYQIAFGFGSHAALPVMLMSQPVPILMMSAGWCLIPVVAAGSVSIACWKIRKDVRKRREAVAG